MTNILDELLEGNEELSDIDLGSVYSDYDPDTLSFVSRNISSGGTLGQCRSQNLFNSSYNQFDL